MNKGYQDVLSKVAEDIRTPANGIMGMLQLAQKYIGEPEKAGDYLNQAIDSGYQLLQTLNCAIVGETAGEFTEPIPVSDYHLPCTLQRMDKANHQNRYDDGVCSEQLSCRRVLAVDDSALNLKIISTILKSEKIEVDCAGNGREAVQCFASHPIGYFRAVLMDIHMPVMDGYEAARAIRGLEDRGGRVPIIAVTTDVLPEDIRHMRQCGMNGHLEKPISVGALLRMLSNC